jgi:hypothetical protein
MDPKISEAVKHFEPCVNYVYKNVPDGFGKDMALAKCQEAIWWMLKAHEDDRVMKEGGAKVETPKD